MVNYFKHLFKTKPNVFNTYDVNIYKQTNLKFHATSKQLTLMTNRKILLTSRARRNKLINIKTLLDILNNQW